MHELPPLIVTDKTDYAILRDTICPDSVKRNLVVTCNAARGDSNAHMRRRAPYNSGFARKSRAKHLEFQAGLYSENISSSLNLSGDVALSIMKRI